MEWSFEYFSWKQFNAPGPNRLAGLAILRPGDLIGGGALRNRANRVGGCALGSSGMGGRGKTQPLVR